MKLMDQELIWMLGLESPASQPIDRKIFEVICDNEVGATFDGSREHVAIVLVWQIDGLNKILVIFNQGVPYMEIHQSAGPLKLGGREIRTHPKEGTNPLIQDRV